MTPNPQPPIPSSGQTSLETENYLDTYQIIAEWIRFADTKAAVTLTVNGVLLGVIIPTLKDYLGKKNPTYPMEGWPVLVVALFLVWLVVMVTSAIYAFRCILPIRGTARLLALSQATHFHPAAVSAKYPLSELDRFVNDCETIGMPGLKREVMAAILIDAHLSSMKYGFVARSIQLLAASVVFGFLYLVAIQF
jgi:hypothetical protein